MDTEEDYLNIGLSPTTAPTDINTEYQDPENEEDYSLMPTSKLFPANNLIFSSVADKAPDRPCPPGYQRDFKRSCKRKF